MGVVPPAVREVVERAVLAVRAAFAARLRSVALFGSHARGEGTARSDVDLAIVVLGSQAGLEAGGRGRDMTSDRRARDLLWYGRGVLDEARTAHAAGDERRRRPS